MRLLHMADLHLGKKLNEASLIEDQRFILTQALAAVDREQPDAVLLAGDIYDKPVPPAEAVALLDDFLTALAARGCKTVVISGNHDSAERLAFGARLLRAQGVALSAPPQRDRLLPAPLTLTDAYGPVHLWGLPFVKPAHVRAALPDEPIDTYTDALRALISRLPLNPAERNVLVCHQFITGGTRSESEDIPVGGLDNVDASVFDIFDYVALGHLHRAQSVGREAVRYAGSPLAYSFGEVGDVKGALLAELGPKGAFAVRAVPLRPLHAVRELRGAYEALTLRAHYQGTATDDYLHITLTDEYDVPDAMGKLRVIYPNLLRLDYDNARTRRDLLSGLTQAPEHRSPEAMLADFYTLQNNRPLDAAAQAYALAALADCWEGRA